MSDETREALERAIDAHLADEFGTNGVADWLVCANGVSFENGSSPVIGATWWGSAPGYRLLGMVEMARIDVTESINAE